MNVLLSRSYFWKYLQVDEFSLIVFHDYGLFCSEYVKSLVVEGVFDVVTFKIVAQVHVFFVR